MPTPHEQRNIRLKNDFVEMTNIRGPIVQWRAVQGAPPFVEAYELTVNVRTIVGTGPVYRSSHVITLNLPSNYPFVPPLAVMTTRPQPYHPNWYANGRWCYGTWDIAEGLGHYVVRMLRTLQFDEEITNPGSAANGDARDWYVANQRRGAFPTDRQMLPDPTHSVRRFDIQESRPKTFRFE
jgi:ubiquitin-protein ligase